VVSGFGMSRFKWLHMAFLGWGVCWRVMAWLLSRSPLGVGVPAGPSGGWWVQKLTSRVVAGVLEYVRRALPTARRVGAP
jgi:hypothetical protein